MKLPLFAPDTRRRETGLEPLRARNAPPTISILWLSHVKNVTGQSFSAGSGPEKMTYPERRKSRKLEQYVSPAVPDKKRRPILRKPVIFAPSNGNGQSTRNQTQ